MIKKIALIAALSLAVAAGPWVSPLSAKAISITGVVEGFSIVTDDGAFYELEYNEKAEELAQHQSSRARVSGSISDAGWEDVIIVNSFSILPEKNLSRQETEEQVVEETETYVEEDVSEEHVGESVEEEAAEEGADQYEGEESVQDQYEESGQFEDADASPESAQEEQESTEN